VYKELIASNFCFTMYVCVYLILYMLNVINKKMFICYKKLFYVSLDLHKIEKKNPKIMITFYITHNSYIL